MKKILLTTALCLGLTSAVMAQGYVPGTADIPLMAGLSAVEGGTLVFDKPDGKVVEAYAYGSANEMTITKFYSQTLAPLGWEKDGSNEFVRNGERLALSFEHEQSEAGTPLTFVKFLVTPR